MTEKYNIPLTGIGEKERSMLSSLLQLGKLTVNAADLMEQIGCNQKKANLILSRLSRKGWLQRLLPGVYGFVPLYAGSSNFIPEDPIALAMELFSPCFITGWTAAEHWDLTEQVFNTVVLKSVHKFRTKNFQVAGVQYFVQHIEDDGIFGVQKIWHNSTQIAFADRHRTVIDILESPTLGAGGMQSLEILKAYWRSDDVNFELLFSYAEKLNNGVIFKRLGFSAERYGKPTTEWLDKCASRITKGVSNFDPAGQNKGKIVTRWNLRINMPLGD